MITKQDVLEIFEAIQNIQQDIPEDATEYSLEFATNGSEARIDFLGVNLWISAEDERDFNEETNKYEPFELFLRRRLQEELNTIAQIFIPYGPR